MGSDTHTTNTTRRTTKFQSTLPGWGATTSDCRFSSWRRYFNPRSPDGERLFLATVVATPRGISIHAPRMGSDGNADMAPHHIAYFNPRSPDGERQPRRLFFSTILNFNPRSPDGERHDFRHRHPQVKNISIHAPRMGSDCPAFVIMRRTLIFQSTLPGWGATFEQQQHYQHRAYFNPRSPDGERRVGLSHPDQVVVLFQSTLPGWGATAKMDIFAHDMGKIIHFQH